MGIIQKATVVAIGIIALLFAPAGSSAQDSVPLTFKEGDVISAEVINALLARLNDAQKGFASTEELVGSWACTTYDNNGHTGCPYGAWVADGNIFKATQTITFTSSNGVVSFVGASAAPGGCGHDRYGGTGTRSGTIRIAGNKYAIVYINYNGVVTQSGGWHDITKLSPTSFQWVSGSPYAFTRCEKASTPPAPPQSLTAAVSGASVTLTWVDQSTNETGFKVQR